INEESEEFLDEGRIRKILDKFCRFLPIPVYFEGQKVNNTSPAWTKKPSELKDEDYKNFYRELYPLAETPLFWIHLNVDYPFNLTGILYFPKIRQTYEMQTDKLPLYCNQVFVTEEVKDIVPEFLMLLHGVIDSPDIPLNVSRSYLQGDPNLKKINSHITKKVADKLEELFNKERKLFEDRWDSLSVFVKYGMMTDDKFAERAVKFLIMQEAGSEKYYTLDEYKAATGATQKNKDGKHVILYTTNTEQQDSYIKAAKDKGYIVLQLDTLIDSAFINQMEIKWEKVQFTRVDAETPDNLIDKSEIIESLLSKEETEKLKALFDFHLDKVLLNVEVKGLSTEAPPVVATRPELMRRMKDMSAISGRGSFYENMPDEVNLIINGNHQIYQNILKETKEENQKKMARNLADLALLSQGLLQGSALTEFINRSVELMGNGKEQSKIILEA